MITAESLCKKNGGPGAKNTRRFTTSQIRGGTSRSRGLIQEEDEVAVQINDKAQSMYLGCEAGA